MQPKFGTSYSIGIKDGWISYLYSSRPLTTRPPAAATSTSASTSASATSSDQIPLRDLLQCYRPLSSHASRHAVGHGLVYGRLYLPQNRLEALLAARVRPEVHLTLRAVSQDHLRHGATLLGLAAWDDPRGRFGVETLASSDGGVLGLRGLWNATNPPSSALGAGAGGEQALSSSSSSSSLPALSNSTTNAASPHFADDSNHQSPPQTSQTSTNGNGSTTPQIQQQQQNDPSYGDKERINGRFSAGGEIYYGLLNKSGGVSVGGRFQTLPTHHGTPLTATLTFNLLGHVSATYAVTSGDCTLASCFGFNMYSYESDWAVGMELWNRRGGPGAAAAAAAPAPTTPVLPASLASPEDAAEGKSEAAGRQGEFKEAERATEDDNAAAAAGLPPTTIMRFADAETPTKVVRTVGTAGEAVMVVPSGPAAGAGAGAGAAPTREEERKRTRERSFQAKLEWRLDEEDEDDNVPVPVETAVVDKRSGDEFPTGVLKCRCDQYMRVGLLYEGRYKSLLFSLGTDVDLKRLDAPFRTVGLAVQFSS